MENTDISDKAVAIYQWAEKLPALKWDKISPAEFEALEPVIDGLIDVLVEIGFRGSAGHEPQVLQQMVPCVAGWEDAGRLERLAAAAHAP